MRVCLIVCLPYLLRPGMAGGTCCVVCAGEGQKGVPQRGSLVHFCDVWSGCKRFKRLLCWSGCKRCIGCLCYTSGNGRTSYDSVDMFTLNYQPGPSCLYALHSNVVCYVISAYCKLICMSPVYTSGVAGCAGEAARGVAGRGLQLCADHNQPTVGAEPH